MFIWSFIPILFRSPLILLFLIVFLMHPSWIIFGIYYKLLRSLWLMLRLSMILLFLQGDSRVKSLLLHQSFMDTRITFFLCCKMLLLMLALELVLLRIYEILLFLWLLRLWLKGNQLCLNLRLPFYETCQQLVSTTLIGLLCWLRCHY